MEWQQVNPTEYRLVEKDGGRAHARVFKAEGVHWTTRIYGKGILSQPRPSTDHTRTSLDSARRLAEEEVRKVIDGQLVIEDRSNSVTASLNNTELGKLHALMRSYATSDPGEVIRKIILEKHSALFPSRVSRVRRK